MYCSNKDDRRLESSNFYCKEDGEVERRHWKLLALHLNPTTTSWQAVQVTYMTRTWIL